MQICVVGMGYVGQVVGFCLSETGQSVICVDVQEHVLEKLRCGQPTLHESGLGEILLRNLKAGRLRFTADLAEGVHAADVIFVAVGTPPLPDGAADLSHVMGVAETIAETARSHKIVVMKSTVPVGTHKVISKLFAQRASVGIDYASNPEFLKQGNAVEDFTRPDRVVIGANSPQVAKTVAHLYSPYMRRSYRTILTDPATAEMIKYAANVMLATRISFMNEIARLCDRFGANVDDVRRGVGADRRIGSAFLFPGLGYGGSCFPKDVRALIAMGRQQKCPMRIAEATDEANLAQMGYFTGVVDGYFQGHYEGRRVAVWGTAYKARTDDTRMSPAIAVVRALLDKGATVVVHDPWALEAARRDLGDAVEYSDHMYDMLEGADALLVLTDWNEFRNPDLERVKALLRNAVVIDGRNLYEPADMKNAGLRYFSVGRPAV